MIRVAILSVLLGSIALPAVAQDSSSFKLGDYGASKRRAAPPVPTDNSSDPAPIHLQGDRWPWLEPGATVCGTEDDLERYHAAIQARLDGQPSPGVGPTCHKITRRTPVDIADRHGPAETEIHLYNDAKQVAWTDAWLPAQRPR
jgi:hypothetical protein